jgi:hypothetical protein
MFQRTTGGADGRHRAFFEDAGEVRQVWALRHDGDLFFLPVGGVDQQIRDDAHAGRLICPYPGCPDPRFIARGGRRRRHHFAHKIAGVEHRTATGWRFQALLMLKDWCSRRYPQLEIDIDESQGSLRVRSPRSGRAVWLTVTYDRRHELEAGRQLLVGHSPVLLLPRQEVNGAPGRWWCGNGRLVGDLIADRGWALAVNPQERLIATMVRREIARAVGLVRDHSRHPLLCAVDDLDRVRLAEDGLHTEASDAVDRELARRHAAEARRAAAEARLAKQRATEAEAARRKAAESDRERAEIAARRALHPRPTERIKALGPHEPHAQPIPEPGTPQQIHTERDWPSDLATLRLLLGDEDLARRLERPLSTDAPCDLPAAEWHLMAALEFRKRGDGAHPAAIRAVLTCNGCGFTLTREAIAGVMQAVRAARSTPDSS